MVIEMKRKRLRGAVLGTVLLALPVLAFSGCEKAEEDTPSSTVPTTTETAPPMLDVDVTSLLTVAEVSDALGVEVGEPQSYDAGTVAHYASADAQNVAEISLRECSRDIYDSTAALYEDAVDSPNLGDAAVWSPQSKQLVAYGQGYMLSVTADIQGKSADECLTAARQMALLILERL